MKFALNLFNIQVSPFISDTLSTFNGVKIKRRSSVEIIRLRLQINKSSFIYSTLLKNKQSLNMRTVFREEDEKQWNWFYFERKQVATETNE